MTTDEYIITLMRKIYGINEEEEQELLTILSWFTEEEKEDLSLKLWDKYQQEESIFKKLFRKLKSISNSLEEIKTKQDAEKILLNL